MDGYENAYEDLTVPGWGKESINNIKRQVDLMRDLSEIPVDHINNIIKDLERIKIIGKISNNPLVQLIRKLERENIEKLPHEKISQTEIDEAIEVMIENPFYLIFKLPSKNIAATMLRDADSANFIEKLNDMPLADYIKKHIEACCALYLNPTREIIELNQKMSKEVEIKLMSKEAEIKLMSKEAEIKLMSKVAEIKHLEMKYSSLVATHTNDNDLQVEAIGQTDSTDILYN